MRCIIVRHGKAEPSSKSGRDEDRELKPRGRRQAEFIARQFSEKGNRPALILASRLERAVTTAKIIQKIAGCPLRMVHDLETGHACSAALDVITRHLASSPLMLVGHNPQLSELVWVLIHGMPVEEAGLRTGEAVELELLPSNIVGTAKELARLRLDGDD